MRKRSDSILLIIIGLSLIIVQALGYIGSAQYGLTPNINFADNFSVLLYDLIFFISYNLFGIIGTILIFVAVIKDLKISNNTKSSLTHSSNNTNFEEKDKLIISVSPHLRDKTKTTTLMLDVVIAMIPTIIASFLIFGLRALVVIAVCSLSCVVAEALFCIICKKPMPIGDLSALVTGIILAFNLPVTIPLWQAVIGSIVAIVIVKQLFGGLGMNFANPALTARIVLFLAFSGARENYVRPVTDALFKFSLEETDVIAGATPLVAEEAPNLLTLLLGTHGGVIGETCALTLILGGIYLIVRKVISFHIPVVFIGTVFVLSFVTSLDGGFMGALHDATYQILAGGLMLGAIFMATDYVTSPCTKWGKVIFGLGCGLITFAIREWGSYPEGVSFSILLMNILSPYITNWTATKPLGGVKVK